MQSNKSIELMPRRCESKESPGHQPSRFPSRARGSALWASLALLMIFGLVARLEAVDRSDTLKAQEAETLSHEILYTDVRIDGVTRVFTSNLEIEGSRDHFVDLGAEFPSVRDARWSPLGDRIVFTSHPDPELSDIFIYDLRVDELIPLSQGFTDIDPSWSPNGEQLVFSRLTSFEGAIQSSMLNVISADGSQSVALTLMEDSGRLIRNPVFSADGQTIVFELRQAAGGSDLYRIGIDGSDFDRIVGHPGWDDIEPAFSPDGRFLAFASGPYEIATERSSHGIWLLDLENGFYGELISGEDGADLRRPAFSPEGMRLAYDIGDHSPAPRLIHIADLWDESSATEFGTGNEVTWRPLEEGAVGTETPIPSLTPATDVPTPINTGTPVTDPTFPPIPTLAPFPTFPPPEPTIEGPPVRFPTPTTPPSPTPEDSPTPLPPSETPEIPPGEIYLPLNLYKFEEI